jgi:hypothetical protein
MERFSMLQNRPFYQIQKSGFFGSGSQKRTHTSVKHFPTIGLRVLSKFARAQTLAGAKPGVCLSLRFQITAKTGGVCYHVSPQSLPLQRTMAVAIAVSAARVCAMAASFDQTLARFKSTEFPVENGFVTAEPITEFLSEAVAR